MIDLVRAQRPRALPPRPTALPEMATAVIILNEDREVEYVNASAQALFAPVEPVGCSMPALLASCGARGGEGLLFNGAASNAKLRLADARVLDCDVRPLSNGGFVVSLDDVTQHVRAAELAGQDALTGLANRKIFHERLLDRLRAAETSSDDVAVLLVDLDRFKTINDTLGHPVGDALLRRVAGRLMRVLKTADLSARFGGDEFAVLQSGAAQPAAAQRLAERLVDLLGRTYALQGHTLNVGASVGIAISPKDGRDPDTLIKNADLALYQAKANGRGRYRFYEPGMAERLRVRRSLELDLRRALALKQFHLLYQPQFDLASDEVVGFEALIRWRRPDGGVVSPRKFIPLAEDIGLITPLSDWVLRTACRQAACWPEPVTVAVNLSPVQFRNDRLPETVASALAHSGLAASRLELEITEGALTANPDLVRATLTTLRRLGVRIAMDDFGAGYSSLSSLQNFPFDTIKIDRAFIGGIDLEPKRLPVLRAIVALAAALGMGTTAEGVETAAELACVRAEGCSQAQGFLTGRPLTAAVATDLLRAPLLRGLG